MNICIIPARGGSKRFPRKNIALFLGKPLLQIAVEVAQESGMFDQICVSSDDPETLEIAAKSGATAMPRPPHLATDTIGYAYVCEHIVKQLSTSDRPVETFAVLLATSPLRKARDIVDAFDILRKTDAHGVMSLGPYPHPPQCAVWAPHGEIVPFFGDSFMLQSQTLDQLYVHDGNIILMRAEHFDPDKAWYSEKMAPLYIEPNRCVDIDRPQDLLWAEFLANQTRDEAI